MSKFHRKDGKLNTRSAVSLIELSIVLVVMGLLTTVVMTGNSLIKSAKLRSLAETMSAAIATQDLFVAMFPNQFPGQSNLSNFIPYDGVSCLPATQASSDVCDMPMTLFANFFLNIPWDSACYWCTLIATGLSAKAPDGFAKGIITSADARMPDNSRKVYDFMLRSKHGGYLGVFHLKASQSGVFTSEIGGHDMMIYNFGAIKPADIMVPEGGGNDSRNIRGAISQKEGVSFAEKYYRVNNTPLLTVMEDFSTPCSKTSTLSNCLLVLILNNPGNAEKKKDMVKNPDIGTYDMKKGS